VQRASVPQAAAMNASRSPGAFSNASPAMRLIACHCSGVIGVGGICITPISAFRLSDSFLD
jgi:hypothetical protein